MANFASSATTGGAQCFETGCHGDIFVLIPFRLSKSIQMDQFGGLGQRNIVKYVIFQELG